MDLKKLIAIQNLIEKLVSHLHNNMQYSIKTIQGFSIAWRAVKKYMVKHNLSAYNRKIGNAVLTEKFKTKVPSKETVPRNQWSYFRAILILTEYSETGVVSYRYVKRKDRIAHFHGEIGKSILDFLKYKEETKRSSETIRGLTYRLSIFADYCDKVGIKKISDISLLVVVNFLESLDSFTRLVVQGIIEAVKGLMKYCYEVDLLPTDISLGIPRFRYIRQSKLPSKYTKEEIAQVINSIDCGRSTGRRNYAIILLIIRTGMRPSDVINLKLSDIHLDRDSIEFVQEKTDRPEKTPLLADVGNAVLNYIKNDRRDCDLPYIFLQARAPKGKLSIQTVTTLVQRAFRHSGVDIGKRHFGPRSIRVSLVARLKENRVSNHMVTEVLNHERKESDRFYTRIDLESLSQCVLDVPLVSSNFYEKIACLSYE